MTRKIIALIFALALIAGASAQSIAPSNITIAAPPNKLSGKNITSGTTTTLLIGAVTSNRIYANAFSCTNTGASASLITFQDGSGGASLFYTIVPAGSGSNLGSANPLFWTTSGNGLYFVAATASTSISCSVAGFSGQ